MKKIKLKQLLLNFGLLSLSLATIFAVQVGIQDACDVLKKVDSTSACSDPAASQAKISDIIATVTNILSMLVGAISSIMVIVGGFKYVTSNGDANQTKSAKDTVTYALIGLLLVGFAQTLVRFVWSKTS